MEFTGRETITQGGGLCASTTGNQQRCHGYCREQRYNTMKYYVLCTCVKANKPNEFEAQGIGRGETPVLRGD